MREKSPSSQAEFQKNVYGYCPQGGEHKSPLCILTFSGRVQYSKGKKSVIDHGETSQTLSQPGDQGQPQNQHQ